MIITNTAITNTLFFENIETGERCKLNNIENIELSSSSITTVTSGDIQAYTTTAQNMSQLRTHEMTGEIKFKNMNKLLYALGLPVPNNWLKMQRLPMKRKLRKRYGINYRA